MIMNCDDAEKLAVLNAAAAMCAAARTAPKACGVDHIVTAILSGDEMLKVADEMDKISREFNNPIFHRDAENVRASAALVLIGAKEGTRGLNDFCRLCHFKDCADMLRNNACCVYDPMDLGIAVGSAVSIAADRRIDNRVFFTAGKAASRLGLLGEAKLIMGIPLAVAGKSPFYDRERRKAD
ncbi:MAG: ferredoxin [Clostridiales bacterium]|mgnify:CR=1 FL=1|jgi:uncharacterized ferredoxin-like protein|nr:ferredoxin [Clostridiales bacterium]